MPNYDYYCKENKRTVEVAHGMNTMLTTWGEVCYAANIPLDNADFECPVRRVIHAPAISIPMSNSQLKEKGFTKLVKRDAGVYENVTALDEEKRYMKAGDDSSLPSLHKKIGD